MRRLVPMLAVLLAPAPRAAQTAGRSRYARQGDHACRRPARKARRIPTARSSRTSTRSSRAPRNTTACSSCTRRTNTSTPRSGRDQFDKPFLCPIAIARGMGMGGYTLNFDEQWVLLFKRVGDKVHLIRRNVHFQAKPGSPVAKAVETTYTDSVLHGPAASSQHPTRASRASLINLNDIFMTDFAQLGLGRFDASRSTWHKVKAFPQQHRAGGGRHLRRQRLVLRRRQRHRQPRHTRSSSTTACASCPTAATSRASPTTASATSSASSRISAPTTRTPPSCATSTAGGWSAPSRSIRRSRNKLVAAEEEDRLLDREDRCRTSTAPTSARASSNGTRRSRRSASATPSRSASRRTRTSIRRTSTTTPSAGSPPTGGFAMGPSRANPLTGEILDADIIFDASMVRFCKQEAKLFGGTGAGRSRPARSRRPATAGACRPLPLPGAGRTTGRAWNDRPTAGSRRRPVDVRDRLAAIRSGVCQCGSHMQLRAGHGGDGRRPPRDKSKAGRGKVPEELIGQAIKEVTMHEVGHTLGLRHNFKASTMLKNEQLHDTDDHPQAGPGRLGHGLRPGQPRPQGRQAGRLLHDHASALTTTGPSSTPTSRCPAAPRARSRSCKKIASEVRRRRASTTAPTRTCTARPTRWSTSGTWAPTR